MPDQFLTLADLAALKGDDRYLRDALMVWRCKLNQSNRVETKPPVTLVGTKRLEVKYDKVNCCHGPRSRNDPLLRV